MRMVVWLLVVLIVIVSFAHLILSPLATEFGGGVAKVSELIPTSQRPNASHVNSDTRKILFIHIPKCGGTSFTSLLREVQCLRNSSANSDCCRNPGSCYIKGYRRCISILGCVSHQPRRSLISDVKYSVVILRQPWSRLVSGWFYPGHNPNNDAFHVRPDFVEIRKGRLQRVTFEEYLRMPEYRNVQTRMLGADSFPYRNVSVNDEVLQRAKDAIDRIFFVGLQEEMVVSSLLLLRMMDIDVGAAGGLDTVQLRASAAALPTERSTLYSTQPHTATNTNDLKGSSGAAANEGEVLVNRHSEGTRAHLLTNKEIGEHISRLNPYDFVLYDYAQKRFCEDLSPFPDLQMQLKIVKCSVLLL